MLVNGVTAIKLMTTAPTPIAMLGVRFSRLLAIPIWSISTPCKRGNAEKIRNDLKHAAIMFFLKVKVCHRKAANSG